MADPIRVLLSQTTFNTDGVTTVWNFSFSGGYLDQTHVRAQRRDTSTGAVTAITLTPGMFTGPYQLTLSPALAPGQELTIYRATPKEGPLVDFTDRAKLTEVSLDYSAKQAIFGVAEADDWRMVVSTAIEAVSIYQAKIATGPVVSVNGRNGSVILSPADVGLDGPLFYIRGTVSQAVTAGVPLRVVFTTEDVDTNNCHTASRFTPTTPGYYNLDARVVVATASTAVISLVLYRNGVAWRTLAANYSATTTSYMLSGSLLAYMNGTDYVEVYVNISTAGGSVIMDVNSAYFSGFLCRL